MKVDFYPVLFLLILIIPIIFFEISSYIEAKKHLEEFRIITKGSNTDKGIESSVFRIKRMFIAVLTVISISALVMAIAGVRWGSTAIEANKKYTEVVILIDISASMKAKDETPDRLTRGIMTVSSVVEQVSGLQVSLIAFNDEAHLLMPLTEDYEALFLQLKGLQQAPLLNGGSDLESALNYVYSYLSNRFNTSSTVLLITDGEVQYSYFDRIGTQFNRKQIPIIIFPVGTSKGANLVDSKGELKVQPDGKPIVTVRNDTSIDKVSTASGGFVVDENDLTTITKAIDFLTEKQEQAGNETFYIQKKDRYLLMAVISFLSLITTIFIRVIKWRDTF